MKMDVAPALAGGDATGAHAGWFGNPQRPRFGWLYRPASACRDTGIVIVPPFGIEDICAHRSLRHLAEAFARCGFPTVRFDLDGCGDSAGDDSDPDRVASWVASVQDACELVRDAGTRRIVLVGLRFGATLAALAALQRDDVAALAAIGGVTRGAHWLHELRALQAAANLRMPADVSEGMEAGGFLLTTATCEAIGAIDLTRLAAPATRALLLERDDLPCDDAWCLHLHATGCDVTQRRLSGYVDMMEEPHRGTVAHAFINACTAWVCSLPDAGAAARSSAALRPAATLGFGATAIRESVVSPGSGIFGVLAEPHTPKPVQALLVVNAGAVRHIGANRFDVGFSRRLAALGVAVLRVDLTGLGDSPPRRGSRENVTFGAHALDDIGVCVAWLRARGACRISVAGICSGATHALGAALAGQPVDAICLINGGVFLPVPGHDPGADRRFRDVAHYSRTVRSARSWRKLLRGKVNLRRVARAAGWKVALQGQGLWRSLARRTGLPLRRDLGDALVALHRRGVKVHFLFSGDDPGRLRLATEAGSTIARLCRSGGCTLQVINGATHTFSQRWAQAALQQALREILLPAGAAAPPGRHDQAASR